MRPTPPASISGTLTPGTAARAPGIETPQLYETPSLLHDLQCDGSILAVAVSSQHLYAGTENGDILVFAPLLGSEWQTNAIEKVYKLDTYDKVKTIHAHQCSVLALYLSKDEPLLLSSSQDRLVNVSRAPKVD